MTGVERDLRVLLVDDEPLARGRLRGLLSSETGVVIVGEAADGASALQACMAQQPDVVFLDVQMPGMDGLEVAKKLDALDAAPQRVMCTAFPEHALDAYEAGAADYLVKPVRAERLQQALARVRQRLGVAAPVEDVGRQTLCVRLGGQMRLIPINDVHCLIAEEKYVVVHHAGGEDLIEESLKSLEESFGSRFVRIHRNCLIARSQLKALRRDADGQTWAVLRDHAQPLEISRRSLPALKALMLHA